MFCHRRPYRPRVPALHLGANHANNRSRTERRTGYLALGSRKGRSKTRNAVLFIRQTAHLDDVNFNFRVRSEVCLHICIRDFTAEEREP
jgi:hypothetical protein